MNTEKKDPFSTTDLADGLKVHAVKSMGITVLAQLIKLFLQLISITVFARLLDATEFGLVAMVTIFTGLALTLVDGGLSMATIQRKEITHAQVSNLFWINVVLGIVLCVTSVLMAPVVARLYSEPLLTPIMVALSVTFLMSGLSVQHDALLRRQMRFKALAVVDILSAALGIVAGISSAIYGLGYWALVIMSVTTAAVQMLLRWWLLSWIPSSIARGSGVRSLVFFGLNLTGANFIGYFVSNATPFFVGFLGGAQVLGLFNRAQSLTSISSSQILPPVIKVLQPILAKVSDDPPKLRRAVIEIMKKTAIVTTFITINMVVLADLIVTLLLGDNWSDAVPIFRFLSLFTIVTPITTFTSVALIVVGEARAFFYWRCITLGLLVVALFFGAFWGVSGVIAAFALSGFFVRMPLFLYYASRHLPLSFGDLMGGLRPVLSVAIVTVLILTVMRHYIAIDNPFLGLIFFSSTAFCIYLLLCISVPSLREEISEGKRLFHLVRGGSS